MVIKANAQNKPPTKPPVETAAIIFGYYRDANFAKTFGVRMFMKTKATIIDLKIMSI